MKKILYFMCLLLATISCNKSKVIEPIFGVDPDERIADTLAYLKGALVDAPNGWKVYTTTGLSGGYGFYVQFSQNDRLTMVADLTDQTSTIVKESTYRVRQIMSASLSFDTYSYITMLQDPNPESYGGTAGKGLESDVEYEYIKTRGDTLFFEGRKFNYPLVLVKANAEEKAKYLSGGYLEAINKVKDFFTENANPYLEVSGFKYQISVNNTSKRISGTTILTGNIVKTTSAKYYYSLDGMAISDTTNLKIGDKDIIEFRWIEGKFYGIDNYGEKYEVKNSVEPLMPLHLLMGTKFSGFYLSFDDRILPGNTTEGTTIINRFFNGLANGTPYFFNCGELSLNWNAINKRITLTGFSSQDNCGGGWNTDIIYDYTLDDVTGVFKLVKRSGPAGGYTAPILDQIDNFLVNSSFRLDYQIDGANVHGKITGIERANVTMTFMMYQ